MIQGSECTAGDRMRGGGTQSSITRCLGTSARRRGKLMQELAYTHSAVESERWAAHAVCVCVHDSPAAAFVRGNLLHDQPASLAPSSRSLVSSLPSSLTHKRESGISSCDLPSLKSPCFRTSLSFSLTHSLALSLGRRPVIKRASESLSHSVLHDGL